jgi:flagellar biosynthesis chaperone FliJ/GTPase SAR1 family protein
MTMGFSDYMALRERLSHAMGQLEASLTGLGADARARHLADARENLLSDAFRLMVVGEFKRGKSTLINALLGQDVLPAKIAPCTAVITELKHGETARAVLHHSDLDRPPVEIPVEELKRYVAIDASDPDDDDEAIDAITQSPYSRVEVFHPLPLLRNNVEIVDSPGLNEHRTRTQIALDYLAKSDALVLVLSCQQALSASELAFLDHELAGRNLRHVFFVWNHHDAVAGNAADEADLRRRTAETILPRVGPDARVYYVSAKQALRGRKGQDPEMVAASGIAGLEAALEAFLANERGRVKLLTPLRAAESAVKEAFNELLPRQEALLAQPVQELQARYEAQQPKLAELRAQRERMLRGIERRRDTLITAAVAAYQAFMVELEAGLRTEVSSIDVSAWEAIAGRRRAQAQMAERLQRWLDGRVRTWQSETLDALFAAHLRDLDSEVEAQSREFLAALDAVRAALAPEVRVSAQARAQDVAAADRLLSAVGGFFIGGIGAAIEGAGHGFKGMSRGLVVHIGLAIALTAAGLGMPVVFPILAAVGVGRTIMEANTAVAKLRTQVVADMGEQLRARLPHVTHEVGFRVTQAFDGLLGAMDAAMAIALDEVDAQARAILAAKAEGEAAMRLALGDLAERRAALVAAGRAVETIRFEVEG